MQVVASRMGDLCGEGGLEGALRALMLDGAGTPRRLKTFTVEVSDESLPKSRYKSIRWASRPTGIDGVSVIICHDLKGELPECELVLDRRPGRFCLVHTAEEDAVAEKAVATMAYTTQVNRAWVCPSVLGELGGRRARGNGNDKLGTVRMKRDGAASADVRCDGMVAHAGGESVEAHLRIAGDVLAASTRMCANAERFLIGTVDTPGGTRFDINPIDIELMRKIEDVPGFISSTLDGTLPLLMEGSAVKTEGGQFHAPTVDLECAHYFGMDISPGLIHVGIQHGCSGSGVLRLLSWLQLHHDPMLRCEQVMAGACGA